jgi:hypothetical protein
MTIILGTKRYEETENGGGIKLYNAKTSREASNVLSFQFVIFVFT